VVIFEFGSVAEIPGFNEKQGRWRLLSKTAIIWVMKIVKQIGIVFAVCWISQVVSRFLPFTFSASIIGMILILVLLLAGILRVEHIQDKSSFLLSNMAFFLIPAGVSVINYFELIGRNILILVFICVVSTIVTFSVTAFTVKAMLLLTGKFAGAPKDGAA
jgi:holin-like protein